MKKHHILLSSLLIVRILQVVSVYVFLFLAISTFGLSSLASASYSDYISSLQDIGISSDIVVQDQPLYRNDVIRLLSTIDCVDCLHPDESLIQKYNVDWRESFKKGPGNNFDDVLWENYYRTREDYYYCVARAADQGIINGYSRDVSPFCPGRFCGANLVKQGEMIQIIVNLKKNSLLSNYRINRTTVQSWLRAQKTTSNAFKNFTAADRGVISSGIKSCGSSDCSLSNGEQLGVYAKYCTRNLGECKMSDFKNLKQGSWPVAEVNILMNAGVMNIIQADAIKPYDLASSQQLLGYLYALSQNSPSGLTCQFDLDYDKDGIRNYQDNCPMVWNPSQFNLDNDRYGDVCDEDIDGDGVLNPMGFVNDAGFLNPVLYRNDSGFVYDNCPLFFNESQIDANINGVGDACEGLITGGNALNIDIVTDGKLLIPTDIALTALSSGYDCGSGYFWNIGNNPTKQGKKVNMEPGIAGMYEIGLIDCKGNIAYTTLMVVDTGSMNTVGLQILPNPIVGSDNFQTTIKPQIAGSCDTIEWAMDDSKESLAVSKGSSPVNIQIIGEGTHTLQAYCYAGRTLKAVAQSSLGVANRGPSTTTTGPNANVAAGSFLTADNIKPKVGQPVKLKTQLTGVLLKDVLSVNWDFGDGSNYKGNALSMIHIYLKPGVSVIRQTIVTKNSTLDNIIQLDVQDAVLENDNRGFSAKLMINPLIGTIQKPFSFQLIPNDSKKILSLLWSFGDGSTLLSDLGGDTKGLKQSHWYEQKGMYQVGVVANLTDGTQASFGGQITVDAQDPCLGFIKKGNTTTKDKPKCDVDKDGLPDVCDDDIDGDGIKNTMGIVKFDNPDCSLTGNNINTPLLINPGPQNIPQAVPTKPNNTTTKPNDSGPTKPNTTKPNTTKPSDPNNTISQVPQKSKQVPYDPCAFTPSQKCNPQTLGPSDPSSNQNTKTKDINDSDGDGLPNYLDNLPTIPLSINSLIPTNASSFPLESAIVSTCVLCPCGFTQTMSPVAAGDLIYSEMKYDGGSVKSNTYEVK